jgi:hypothetical protein
VTANATVYLSRALTAAAIRSVARAAKVTAVAGDVLAVVELGAVRVTITQMSAEVLAAHLAGVRNFVHHRCAVDDDSLAGRLDHVVQVLALVIEPALDAAGKTAELIHGLARAGHGVTFDGIRFRDLDGRTLATRRAEPAGDPTAPPGTASVELEGITTELADPAATGETPSADRVLARARVLSAVAVRAFLEEEPRVQATEMVVRIRRWLTASAVAAELERDERELIDTAIGSVTAERRTDATWRSEGLAVLGWALGVSELPDHATPVDAGAVAAAVGFLAPEPPPAVAPPRLRSAAELDWMARRLTGLRWRLKELWTRRDPVDFRAFARNAASGSFDLIGIALADDDLAIDGVAITRVPRARMVQCHSIAVERHQAIAWLRGQHRVYSKVESIV